MVIHSADARRWVRAFIRGRQGETGVTPEGRGPMPIDRRGGRADPPAGRWAGQRGRPGAGPPPDAHLDPASPLAPAFDAVGVYQPPPTIVTGWNQAATRADGGASPGAVI